MRTWPLLRNAHVTRAVGCIGISIAVPTVGLAFTLLVAAIPVLLGTFAPDFMGLALALSVALWLSTAAAVGWAALRLAQRSARARLRSGSVAVGADGVAVRRLWKTHFLPWTAITDVRRDETTGAVVLERVEGPPEALLVKDSLALEEVARNTRRAFESRSKSARLRVLGLEGRVDRSWVARAKQATQTGTYREEAVTQEGLLGVLEDAAQAPEQRIAAALALSTAAPEVTRRVRVAVEETAEPKLAEALEQAVDGDVKLRSLRRAVER